MAVIRNLDGVYFRVKRDEKYQAICFSDLTESEMEAVLKHRSEEWLKNLCVLLGQVIKKIGDHFDIINRAMEESAMEESELENV